MSLRHQRADGSHSCSRQSRIQAHLHGLVADEFSEHIVSVHHLPLHVHRFWVDDVESVLLFVVAIEFQVAVLLGWYIPLAIRHLLLVGRLVVHGIILFQIAVHIAPHTHDQTHIIAVERQTALEDKSCLVARLYPEGVFDVVAGNAYVRVRVEHQVMYGGEVSLFLFVPCCLDAVVLCLLVGVVQNRGFENGCAVVDANDIERQLHLFLVISRQGEVLLAELHFWLHHLEMHTVGVTGFCRCYHELHNAFFWRLPCFTLWSSHVGSFPTIHHAMLFHVEVVIDRTNLDALRQGFIHPLRPAVG